MSAPAPESPARIRELLALYRRTHYDVALPDGNVAILRVGAAPPRAVADWIAAAPFALYLSACNPYSQALPADANHERMTRLRGALERIGARWLEGRGHIPGERWSEPSLLLAGPTLDRVDRIAQGFEQNAGVLVVANQPVRLRLYRRDWRGRVADTDLEE